MNGRLYASHFHFCFLCGIACATCKAYTNLRFPKQETLAYITFPIRGSEFEANAMNAKEYRFCEKVGHGGHKCPCCGDAGIKRRNNRKHRHQSKKDLKKGEVG